MDIIDAKPTSRFGKKKLVLIVLAVVTVAIYLGNLQWRYTGSQLWEPVGEKYGVKVYSKKTPGEDMLDFKGTVKVKSSLSAAVALFLDPDSCPEWMPGCFVGQYVETLHPEKLYYIHSYIMELPFPFQRREAILKTKLYQNPDNQQVVINFTAMPDKLPPNDCCLRVTHVNNTWRFTPLHNGEVEVTLETDADFGGNIPDILVNIDSPRNLYQFLSSLQGFLDREKYQTAQFDFIQEPSNPQVSQAEN